MDIHEALRQYKEAYKAIDAYFSDGGVFSGDHPSLMLEFPWFLNGSQEISFADPDNKIEEEDFEYAYEVRHTALWIGEEYTAARVDDGCGNVFCVIFDNGKRRKEFES